MICEEIHVANASIAKCAIRVSPSDNVVRLGIRQVRVALVWIRKAIGASTSARRRPTVPQGGALAIDPHIMRA